MDGQNTNPQDAQASNQAAPTSLSQEGQQSAQPMPASPAVDQTPVASSQPATDQPQAIPQQQAPAQMPTPPSQAIPETPAVTQTPSPAPQPDPVAPEAAPAAPAAPQALTTDSMQQTVPLPAAPQPTSFSQQPPAPKKGISIWLVLSAIVLILAAAGWYYFYLLNKSQPVQETTRIPYPTKAVVSPTVAVSLTPSVTSSQSAIGQGSVSGTLCYPASAIPAGTITAKDIATNKLYTQAYAGTAAGGGTKYTFALPSGMYHLKFTPTQYPTVVGYYTDYSSCVGNPVGPNCSGQKVRPLLTATVSAKFTVQNVNLCDYYYPTSTPPQF